MRHLETELVAFVRGELAGPARDRVARHLASCAACRATGNDFRDALDALRGGAPGPPAVHWPRYRAEVRQKLEARRERATAHTWWRWPVPLALSAALAGVLLALAVDGGLRTAERSLGPEEAAIAPRLELLRNYRVVERLDLLEDLDILTTLDGGATRREG